ncbi:hypothetical protein [Mycobacterium sp. 1245111.1]|uniref:hypothetical protein n=1 Tax=Mycobacterium sp. 1245111.1 TaxID=1834073 RepID=UPI000A6E26AC|nr:hypothetical protein [Mycobacterium sp. 1245111.1]
MPTGFNAMADALDVAGLFGHLLVAVVLLDDVVVDVGQAIDDARAPSNDRIGVAILFENLQLL